MKIEKKNYNKSRKITIENYLMKKKIKKRIWKIIDYRNMSKKTKKAEHSLTLTIINVTLHNQRTAVIRASTLALFRLLL